MIQREENDSEDIREENFDVKDVFHEKKEKTEKNKTKQKRKQREIKTNSDYNKILLK